jgi:hypothetical protein
MKGPSMRLDLVTRTVVSVDPRCLTRTCPCSERTEKAWPRVVQRIGFWSSASAASWSQLEGIPSGRLQWPPQPSLRLFY